ncbi:tRNA threonylcarbamoyladenosine biosynthesis protein TsaB [Undibacterium sp. GrIS 1.8]|uniref:tRNA (adenosine(37)-N6)-threonylcarbamoyltransferase complex dimerization subunit type 1 TsaB n=1 Tax=unclassified Undibacterium TaxID=2630295 RepID=UPI00339B45BA
MTTLLAIETSTELASAALLIGDTLISRELTGVQTHSQGILPAIQSLLLEAGLSLKQCDAIAFGCGPGAFTGVRTACGIVQGLAFGTNLPILPVVSLQAMAESARQQHVLSNDVVDYIAVLDARMGEVYWAQYRYLNSVWQVIVAPTLSKAEEVRAVVDSDLLDSSSLVFALGQGVVLPENVSMAESFSAHLHIACMPHARQIAQLALPDYLAGRGLDASQAQPLYLRNKIALTTAERMQLKAAS